MPCIPGLEPTLFTPCSVARISRGSCVLRPLDPSRLFYAGAASGHTRWAAVGAQGTGDGRAWPWAVLALLRHLWLFHLGQETARPRQGALSLCGSGSVPGCWAGAWELPAPGTCVCRQPRQRRGGGHWFPLSLRSHRTPTPGFWGLFRDEFSESERWAHLRPASSIVCPTPTCKLCSQLRCRGLPCRAEPGCCPAPGWPPEPQSFPPTQLSSDWKSQYLDPPQPHPQARCA